MNQHLFRRTICAGILTATVLGANLPNAYAQFVTVVEGQGQQQLNPVNEPSPDDDPLQSLSSPFAISANGETLSGNLFSTVYSNDFGGLDFFYQIQVTTTTGGVTATNLSDFTGFTTASAFRTDGDIDGGGPFTAGGKRPFGSQRVSGGVVAFAFNSNPLASGGNSPGVLLTGDRSSVLIVRTDATNFRIANGTVNAGAAANAAILGPTAGIFAVPEVNTFALLLPGVMLGAITVMKRRLKK